VKKKMTRIPMDDACNIIASALIRDGRIPPDTKVSAIVPANGRSYIAFEWEEEK